jgi:hypothetical protein
MNNEEMTNWVNARLEAQARQSMTAVGEVLRETLAKRQRELDEQLAERDATIRQLRVDLEALRREHDIAVAVRDAGEQAVAATRRAADPEELRRQGVVELRKLLA